MTEEVKNRIVQNLSVFGINEAIHGFVVMLDNKIWKNRYGAFIFDSRQEANQAFYNGTRWQVTRIASAAIYGTNSHGWPQEYDRSRELWMEFKRAANFQIVEI